MSGDITLAQQGVPLHPTPWGVVAHEMYYWGAPQIRRISRLLRNGHYAINRGQTTPLGWEQEIPPLEEFRELNCVAR